MPEPYMKQLDVVPETQKISEMMTNFLNSKMLPDFEKMTGVNISAPGDKVPVSNGVPRLFILDEKDPTHPRSLEEENVAVGSALFWELAQKGRLFAYPAGQKEPVQLQLKVPEVGAPELFVSEPLSTQPDKLASRNFSYAGAAFKPKRLPPEVPRPGLWARIAHSLNSNWYRREFEAYENNRQRRSQISEENRQRKETHDQAAQQAKQSTDNACLAVSKGLEAAFSAKRSQEALAAEREARRLLLEERAKAEAQAKLDSDALRAEEEANISEDRIGNMVSIYGTKPAPLKKLEDLGVYNNEKKRNPNHNSFTVLKPVNLPKDMKIGEKTVDDRTFASLALYSQLTPEIGIGLKEPQGGQAYRQLLLDEGLTEKEADDLFVTAAGGMVVADFLSHHIRVDLDQYFEKRTQPGRERAEKALEEYRKGNKAPLAEIITGAAKFISKCTADEYAGSRTTLTMAKLTGELLDLLEEDPELKQAAMEKGLTEQMVENCRGMDALREMGDKCLQAEAKLKKAVAEHRELSKDEKTQCLKDIFKYRTADAMYKEQAKDYNGKNYMAVKKNLQDRRDATIAANHPVNPVPMPEGMKPMDAGMFADITAFHYRPKLFRTPSVIKEIAANKKRAEAAENRGEDPKPDDLDKIAEMTVNGLRLPQKDLPLAELDTKTLADNLIGDNAPVENKLLEEQGKLLAAQEREKKQVEDAEKALNTAVIYEPVKSQKNL